MEKIYKDIESILVSKEEISKRVKEIGEQITKEFAGEEIVVIGVLKGSSIFMADLIREIDLPMDIDFLVA